MHIITEWIRISSTKCSSFQSSCNNPFHWYAYCAHSTHIHSIDRDQKHKPFQHCSIYELHMHSVTKPWNYPYTTTNYQSLHITTDSKGIHNKLQFFIQILNIPVAFINSIFPATQNETFLENGYNRMKTLS